MPADSDRPSHWDFMLEADDTLLTWQWDELPKNQHRFHARQLEPHRVEYLSQEGELSHNRGTVTRIDQGTFTPAIKNLTTEFEILLQLQQFSGTLTGKQVSNNQWLFEFTPAN